MTETVHLDRTLQHWRRLPARRHAAALALLVLVAALRWHDCVFAAEALIDEATYLEAFRASSQGRSPYEVGSFHYTPLFAWFGARLMETLDAGGTRVALRLASLAGLAFAVWYSSAWLAVSWERRLALAAAYIALAPAVGAGLCTGNVSFAVVGVILVALAEWSERSVRSGAVPAGLALGATVAAKPLAPLALVALFFHRSAGAGESSRNQELAGRVAGVAGGLVAVLLLAPMAPQLLAMSSQLIHPLSYARSFSLQRLLSLAGLEVPAVGVFFGGAVALILLLRFVRLDRSQLLAVAVTAAILVTPIVWNHTLVLALPVQVMALAVASTRLREAVAVARRQRLYELAFVALGVLAIQFSEGFGAVDELSRGAQFFFLALPCFAPALLTAYLVGSTIPSPESGERRNR